MTISEDAVEAAARAGYNEVQLLMGFPTRYDLAPKGTREAYALFARAALTAAAPLVLAEAWRSGFCAGSDHGADPFHPPAANPYKPAP